VGEKTQTQSRRTFPGRGTRHILLADDGSAGAAKARDFALMLVAMTGARLTVVCVREPADSARDVGRKLAATRAAAAAAGIPWRVAIARPVGVTNPGRRILEAARRRGADLIVIGARGAGLTRKLLGSVSSYVASRTPTSVCVIR
jgi:nucleotide-binding universal stress UspA family protein